VELIREQKCPTGKKQEPIKSIEKTIIMAGSRQSYMGCIRMQELVA
jgi:hypothetical protein